MHPVKEFRNYARNCRGLAHATKDPESKAQWLRMAERWTSCAKLAEEDEHRVRDKDEHHELPRRHIYGSHVDRRSSH
jgi:hypothetical protein